VGNTRPLLSHRGSSSLPKMPSGRNWLFTLNNPSPSDIPNPWPEWIKICVYQMEKGAEGTEHLQGYLEVKHSIRLGQLKTLLPRAHLEKRRGTRRDALIYVTKEETRVSPPTLYGISLTELERITSKCSGTLLKLQEHILANPNLTEEELADKYFDIWVKYHRAISRYLVFKTPVRNWPVEVIVIVGPTGTGKSKWALDNFPGAYWKQRSNWWDGYDRHETIIIDEYYGWLPFDLLLRLCDRYPLLLETKGGQVQCVCKTIIITSNKRPCDWYKTDVYFDSLKRRISRVLIFNSMLDKAIFTNYDSIIW